MPTRKPLVYACSGCSSAAQLANAIAIRLHRSGLAQMSCIAGVGGDVPSLVKLAKSGRTIIALDGCPLECVRCSLARHGIEPTRQHTLSEYGVKKSANQDAEPADQTRVYDLVSTGLP